MEGLKKHNLKKYEKKLVSAIDRYELLRLFSVSGNKVVAIIKRGAALQKETLEFR